MQVTVFLSDVHLVGITSVRSFTVENMFGGGIFKLFNENIVFMKGHFEEKQIITWFDDNNHIVGITCVLYVNPQSDHISGTSSGDTRNDVDLRLDLLCV